MTKFAQYGHNHVVDKETGFIENPAYPHAFDAEKKKLFLNQYKLNGLDLYKTCDDLGMEWRTYIKHFNMDTEFKQRINEARAEYVSRLEGKSRMNALNNDKSVIERLAQLNSFSRMGLTHGKYTDDKSYGAINISINVDGKAISEHKKRDEILEAELVEQEQIGTQAGNQKQIDSQAV